MTGLAKLVAFLNILAACAFLYLATQDYNARRPWAYQVFRAELAIDGLPVDANDSGPRRVAFPLTYDLDDTTLGKMFAEAGGNPPQPGAPVIRTQQDELERVQLVILDELTQLKGNDEKVRTRLREMAMALSFSIEERDYWDKFIRDPKNTVDSLIKAFDDEFFERAKQETPAVSRSVQRAAQPTGEVRTDYHSPLTRRQLIAHVLYNLTTTPPDHYRVMVVVGLRAYVNEAEGQASRLRELGQRVRLAMLDERQAFQAEYTQLVQRILSLVEELAFRQQFYDSQVNVKKRNEDLKKIREADKAELEAKLKEAEQQVGAALEVQGTLEKQLFEVQKQVGEMKRKTEEMERFISGLEVRVRK